MLTEEQYAIGVEIGGTKLQAALGDRQLGVLHLRRRLVEPQNGADGILMALPALLDELVLEAGVGWSAIAAIGIGFGGPVDMRQARVITSFQVGGWTGFPLAQWAQERWGRPAVVANDAAAAGLAEATVGAGKGARRVFYITVGSGIGGGWIVDGRIDSGQGIGMAELGHTFVPHPQTGAAVELESVCSGWAIGHRARAAAEQQASTMAALAGGVEAIDSRTVYAAAEAGDGVAQQILHETTATLGLALANVIALFHPEIIVLGGGVSLMGPLFWDSLRAEVSRRAMPAFAAGVRIARAALGEEVVPVGGLCLAWGAQIA
jgi:glucokinase